MIVHGIDFSGASAPWRNAVSKPTVWIATVELGGTRQVLSALRPVQELPGREAPFSRLVRFLASGEYAAAAIDAPFSLPARHLPGSAHRELLNHIRTLPGGDDRPFPRGASILQLARAVAELERAKPLRDCERGWGVNTRSTLWNGRARPGAPFVAACLTLLARSGRPCWPWSNQLEGLLVEAFPAAQLKRWGLPHSKYAGKLEADQRRVILGGLGLRLKISDSQADLIIASADALDAVIASLAAVAVVTGALARTPPASNFEEGWIAVHS